MIISFRATKVIHTLKHNLNENIKKTDKYKRIEMEIDFFPWLCYSHAKSTNNHIIINTVLVIQIYTNKN